MPLLYSCPGRMRRDNRQLYLVNTSMVHMRVRTMDILLPAPKVVRSCTPIANESRSIIYKTRASLSLVKTYFRRKKARHFDKGRLTKAPDFLMKNGVTYCFYFIYMP